MYRRLTDFLSSTTTLLKSSFMKYFIIFLLSLFTIEISAQGKGKAKGHGKHKKTMVNHKHSFHIPPGLAKKFGTEHPGVSNLTWKSAGKNYMAKYKANSYWTTTTYTRDGQTVETKTFFPPNKSPNAISLYKAAHPSAHIGNVVRLELPQKEPVYRVEIQKGEFVYLNDNGIRVNF
jgi:hypothetical protein